MQKPPTWELTEAVHTTAVAPIHIPVASGTSTTIPNSGMFGPHNFGPQNLVVANFKTIEATKAALAQEYQNRAQQLPQTLENELAATRLEGTPHPLPPADSLVRELGVRTTLLQRKNAEFQQKTALANRFYGSDPLDKELIDFYQKAVTLQNPVMPGGIAIQAWTASYRAAHDARLLAQSIQMLNQQQINVQNWLATVQANDRAQAADAEAQRLAAERARIAAEQQRQRELAEAARREQAQILAREQARLAAMAEAQRLAVEQARLAAEAAQRHIAAEQSRLAAEAQRLRQIEAQRAIIQQQTEQRDAQNRLEQQKKDQRKARRKQQRQARLQARAAEKVRAEQARLYAEQRAQTEARWERPEFANIGSLSAFGPTFVGTLGSLGSSPADALAIRSAFHSAITIATAAISTAAAPVLVGFAALLVPSELGNGDLFSASVPLSELAPDLTTDLYDLATTTGEIDLPVRLGSRTIGNKVEIVVVSTDGATVPSAVPVRVARYDAQKAVYVSSSSDNETKGPIVTWTPLVEPLNPSTESPWVGTDLPVYVGAEVTPDSGRIDLHPQWDRYGFGGWITVFPIESGIAPVFTMFRDRRQDPGVASGVGQPVSGNWLGAAATTQGAAIPEQIANRLRGREFSSFRAFRKAFWKAIAADKDLLSQFSHIDRSSLLHGLSPKPKQIEHIGKRRKYELHHVIPVELGGAVYDMDNLKVLTPKQHIKIHSLKKGAGK